MERKSMLKRGLAYLIASSATLIAGMSLEVTAKEPFFPNDFSVISTTPVDESVERVIQDIRSENAYAISIVILECGYAEPSSLKKSYDNIKKTVTRSDSPLDDKFITSSAKGMTLSSSTKFESSVNSLVTGKLNAKALGLTARLGFSMEPDYTLTGPPEYSKANTREYRVKFYGNTGTYTAAERSGLPGGAGMMMRDITGTWSEPLKYYIYAVDRAI